MVRGATPGAPPPIVLLGGSAGAGTAEVGERLARELDVLRLRADSYWLALKAVTSPDQYPDLHLFPGLAGTDHATAERLARRLVGAAQVVCEALEPAVRFQSHAGPGLVVEGTWLLPSLAAKLADPGVSASPVRAAFLFEPDLPEILAAMRAEAGSGTPRGEIERLAETSHAFGLWLRDEAARFGLPVVEARPGETAVQRVRDVLGL